MFDDQVSRDTPVSCELKGGTIGDFIEEFFHKNGLACIPIGDPADRNFLITKIEASRKRTYLIFHPVGELIYEHGSDIPDFRKIIREIKSTVKWSDRDWNIQSFATSDNVSIKASWSAHVAIFRYLDKRRNDKKRKVNSHDSRTPSPDAISVQMILTRMAKTYRTCRSYRDSGVVKTETIYSDGKRTREITTAFATAFVRPDRFRFEFTTGASPNFRGRYIIWRNGNDVKKWWYVRPVVKKPKSLASALGGAAGVSRGTSKLIPALLIPKEVTGSEIAGITEAKRIADAKLGKVDCFCIQGQFRVGAGTLWIEKKSFLVRKLVTSWKEDDFSTRTIKTYKPFIDGEVADKMLEFDPPKPE